MTVPEAMGGGGADAISFVLAAEAIAQGCASTALIFLTHSVVARVLAVAGNDGQKERFLAPLVAGHTLGSLAATEPTSGANPLAFPRPPLRTWLFTTTGYPMRSATVLASGALAVTSPSGTGIPVFRNSDLPSNSYSFIMISMAQGSGF